MELINRIWNGVTYSWSTLLTGVGVMTQKDWLTAIGILIGIAAAALGELHRRRMKINTSISRSASTSSTAAECPPAQSSIPPLAGR